MSEWWPTDTVAPFIFYGVVAGPNATDGPTSSSDYDGVPVNAYVKRERFLNLFFVELTGFEPVP